jgi:hypothetical protein
MFFVLNLQVEISRQPIHALAAIKKIKDLDTPTVWEALSSDYSEAWMEAMMSAKIKSLQARRTWKIREICCWRKTCHSRNLKHEEEKIPRSSFQQIQGKMVQERRHQKEVSWSHLGQLQPCYCLGHSQNDAANWTVLWIEDNSS